MSLVARVACREALLDGVGQLRLSGVVGDGRVDAGREVGVLAPDRTDEGLGLHLVADDHLDPGGEALGPDRRDRDPDGDVVVAGLVAPRAGRDTRGSACVTGTARSVRSSTVGATWRTNRTSEPCGAHTRSRASATPRPMERCASSPRSRPPWPRGSAMMSTVPSSAVEIRRSSSTFQLSPTPRQSHWNTPLAGLDGAVELGGGLTLLLAVGQQDGVALRRGCGEEELAEGVDPRADRRRPRRADLAHDPLRLVPHGRVHRGEHRVERVDHLGPGVAGDDREPGCRR